MTSSSPRSRYGPFRNGRPARGCWLSLGSTGAAEILGRAGFDWLLIDQQHSAVGPELLLEMVRAVNASGSSPMVRIPRNEPNWFDQALDAGAHGVMVPMISDQPSAERAVASARYPPHGSRSIGGYRAQYSFAIPREEYLHEAGAMIELWMQIEDREAVKNADAIANVPGVTGLFVGPQDLAADLGLSPVIEPNDERFEDALERLLQVSARSGRPLGILTSDADSAERRVQQGFEIVAISSDARILASAGGALLR